MTRAQGPLFEHILAVPVTILAEGDDHRESGLGVRGCGESGSGAVPSLTRGKTGIGGGGGLVADAGAGVGGGGGGTLTVDARFCV
jgi:hypothetical protein